MQAQVSAASTPLSTPVSGRGPFCSCPYPARVTQPLYLESASLGSNYVLTPSLSRAAFQQTVLRIINISVLEPIKENHSCK